MKHTYLVLLVFIVTSGSAQEYFLNGNAVFLGNDCYRLTSESTFQNGTVWYGEQIDIEQPFDIQFTMNFGTIDGNGADGICFVLQTVGTSAIGASGGGLGYLNFGTSLGIEFDTWQNGEYNDQGYDHIAIIKNGDINHNSSNNIAGPVQADVFSQNIEDGEEHVVRITWNPVSQTISVYFDCVFRLSGQQDIINQIFGGENMVYWGFTAATGGSYNNQTVCLQENILSVGDEVTICSGMSTTLSAGSSLDGVYNWSPQDFLDNPNSATPTANPTESITYTVTFTDLCNNPVQATIDVNVVELEVTHDGESLINCINELSDHSASINFNADVFYSWELNGDPVSQGLNNDVFQTGQPGQYIVNANVDDVCFASAEFTVDADFSQYQADIISDGLLNCYSQEVELSASLNAEDASFQWFYNGQNMNLNLSEIMVGNPGTYTLQVTNVVSGCSTQDQLIVTENLDAPLVNIPLQDTLSCISNAVEFSAIVVESDTDYSIVWSTTNGNIASGSTTLSPTVVSPGTYQLVVTNVLTGCQTSATTNIVEQELFNIDLSSLTFPNIFTPNDDSKNETWGPYLADYPEIRLSEITEKFELKIYNRWGNLLFESDNAGDLWNGGDHEPGVYYYHLQFLISCGDGASGNVEGIIHLTR